jgi:sugar-specific transcriptional regulator TrmB
MITNPTVYKAVPIHDGAPMLLERQTQEYQEIRLRTKELLRRNTRSDKEKLPQQEYQFALIPHNRATWRKLDEMKERSQKNCDFLFYWKAFSMFGIESVMHFLKKPADKGLNVRLITYMNEGEKLHKKVLTLQDKGNFKVRCTFDSPPIRFVF